MPDIIFALTTKNGIEIRLTKTQWKHISYRHPEMAGRQADIKETILNPTAIRKHSKEITKFYKFLKDKKQYIMVAVKLLDHEGFVATAYLTLKIQKEKEYGNEKNNI